MITLVLLLLILLIAYNYYKEANGQKWDELDELKFNILDSIAKDKEQERHEKAVQSIILYESTQEKRKPFKIDNKGNVEYIKYDEL